MKKHFLNIAPGLVSGLLLATTFLIGCSMESHRARRAQEHAFIEYHPLFDNSGRLRLAVKDNIDMKGEVTTAGSEYLARTSPPAASDASCLAIVRERHIPIVGKTNLTEFAVTVSGENSHFGTPRNRFDGRHEVIPGGYTSMINSPKDMVVRVENAFMGETILHESQPPI